MFLYEKMEAARELGAIAEAPDYIATNMSSRFEMREYQRQAFENFRLFGGFCGRDSGIGPAQRAKTTIWN